MFLPDKIKITPESLKFYQKEKGLKNIRLGINALIRSNQLLSIDFIKRESAFKRYLFAFKSGRLATQFLFWDEGYHEVEIYS